MGEPQCRKLYETVGVYLGYGLAQYCEFYKIDHVMILGRVSKGSGGDLMLGTAKKVLETEFPEIGAINFHTADDHFKAVGQCIAAAALPALKTLKEQQVSVAKRSNKQHGSVAKRRKVGAAGSKEV